MATSTPREQDHVSANFGPGQHGLLAEIVVQSDAWADVADAHASIQDAVRVVSESPDLPGVRPQEVSIVLSDDAAVRELNKMHRKMDKPTNVLSFPSPPQNLSIEVETVPYLGDVVLAFETIAGEAKTMQRGVNAHLSHLVIHGLLHLLGFDHETDDEAQRMEHLEAALLAKLGFANPYEDLFQEQASE